MTKRWRIPKAKSGELKIAYGIPDRGENPCPVFCYGGGGVTKRDVNMLIGFFGYATMPGSTLTLMQELEARGYDITTLKFSIQKKVEVTDGAA